MNTSLRCGVWISPDDQRAVSLDGSRNVSLWDVPERKRLRHWRLVGTCPFQADIQWNASRFVVAPNDCDGSLQVWDLDRGDLIVELYREHTRGKFPLAVTETRLIWGRSIWDLETLELIVDYEVLRVWPRLSSPTDHWWTGMPEEARVIVSRNQSRAGIALFDGDRATGWIVCLDLPSGAVIRDWASESQMGQDCIFGLTGDGRCIVSCGGDGLQIWDVESGRQVNEIETGWVPEFFDLTITTLGTHAAVVYSDGTGAEWDLINGEKTREFPTEDEARNFVADKHQDYLPWCGSRPDSRGDRDESAIGRTSDGTLRIVAHIDGTVDFVPLTDLKGEAS